MKRTVRRELIDKFIREQERDGLRVLSEITKVPTSSIAKIRQGRIPKNPLTRIALANGLRVSESELFPSTKGQGRAS